ncbi:MAG: NADPH-dependent FMN reductase [Mariniblastus sp.]
MTQSKILAFAGSSRTGSHNFKLVQVAAKGAREAGAEVTILDMNDYALPLFNEDLEIVGTPENVSKLKQLFIEHDGLLIASPEYNSSVSPLLKNLIDWVSRPAKDESPLAAYNGKVASIMSTSPGGLGGLRGLVHLRSILGNIGVVVLPDQVAVGKAFEAFDDEGNLKDESQRKKVMGLGSKLASITSKLNG